MRLMVFLLLLCPPAIAGDFTAAGVGGGGWLHAGAVLPSSDQVVVLGADVSGAYLSEDGGAHWRPWNTGLTNGQEARSFYVDDLLGVARGDWEGFYAATQGGIFRRQVGGDWQWMTPPPAYAFKNKNGWNPETISFACLDWDGADALVAGAGRVRWRTTYETSSYPGLDAGLFEPYGGTDEQWTVWTLDLASATPSWTPMAGSTFGAARDISVARVQATSFIVVATPTGIYLHDGDSWQDLSALSLASTGAALSTVGLSPWSLHLTERGTLYAAMLRGPGNDTHPSGVYRIFDIGDLANSEWTWVGDDTSIPPENVTLAQVGLDNSWKRPDLIYLSVVDGAATEADLLYLGARNATWGLYRGEQAYAAAEGTCTWEHKMYQVSGGATFGTRSDGTPYAIDLGYLTIWGPQAIFHPVVSEFHPNFVLLHDNARLHVSTDRGDTWVQSYTTAVGAGWASTGYNELCVAGLDFMSDGRLVEGTGDVGTFRSLDASHSALEWLLPEVDASASAASNVAWNQESEAVHVRANWRGGGQDAVFINQCDVIQKNQPGKIFMFNPGFDVTSDWINITASLPDLDRYLFGDFVFTDDSTLFVGYTKYDRRVGSSGAIIAEEGILKGLFAGNVWNWTPWNDGLVFSDGSQSFNSKAVRLLHHAPSGRIFMAARDYVLPTGSAVGITERLDVKGNVFILASADATTWQPVFAPDNGRWLDFRSIAQAQDGSVLYAGTRGRATGWGSVLKCSTPASATQADCWVPLANTDETGSPFSITVPFWATTWDVTAANRKLTAVAALAVSPWDADTVYVGLTGEGMATHQGLWVHEAGATWRHLSPGEGHEGTSVSQLAFNPAVPGQLVVGTHCLELFHMTLANPHADGGPLGDGSPTSDGGPPAGDGGGGDVASSGDLLPSGDSEMVGDAAVHGDSEGAGDSVVLGAVVAAGCGCGSVADAPLWAFMLAVWFVRLWRKRQS